tara:strand:- start:51871 stop:52335 length:465 start_codon:yes stop_codon:yes gene_type:complete
MKQLVFTSMLIFLTISTNYAQEKTETPKDSVAMAKAAEDAAILLRIKTAEKEAKEAEKELKKAEKEAKKAEKKAKKLEKEAEKAEKLQKSIAKAEKSIEKSKSKIINYEDKIIRGKAKGKLSPVDISKLNDKISKERSAMNKTIEKLDKLKRKQ